MKFFLVYNIIAAATAFSPVAKSGQGKVYRTTQCCLQESKHVGDREPRRMPRRSDFLAAVGTLFTGAIVSGAEPVNAEVPLNPSSSMYLSEEIKTLDFALPSSYDSLNDLKANEKALGVEDAPEPKEKGKQQPKRKAEASSGGNSPLGAVLPSMNKSGPSKKPPKPAGEKPKKPVKEKAEPAPKVEVETMDLALPSYSDGTGTRGKSVFSL